MKGNNPSDPYEHCAGSDVELHRPCGRIVQAKGNKYFAIGRNIKFWRDLKNPARVLISPVEILILRLMLNICPPGPTAFWNGAYNISQRHLHSSGAKGKLDLPSSEQL